MFCVTFAVDLASLRDDADVKHHVIFRQEARDEALNAVAYMVEHG